MEEAGHMSAEEDALLQVANMMALAARTAPKARGEDYIDIVVITGPELQKLGKAMLKFGERVNDMDYERDGMCVRNSTACLIVGVRDPLERKGTPKGKEGRKGGSKGDFYDESERVKRYLDLGIALGSAAKTASILNADCRQASGYDGRHGRDWDTDSRPWQEHILRQGQLREHQRMKKTFPHALHLRYPWSKGWTSSFPHLGHCRSSTVGPPAALGTATFLGLDRGLSSALERSISFSSDVNWPTGMPSCILSSAIRGPTWSIWTGSACGGSYWEYCSGCGGDCGCVGGPCADGP
jgi:uncharacterized ferredoxin-like protein